MLEGERWFLISQEGNITRRNAGHQGGCVGRGPPSCRWPERRQPAASRLPDADMHPPVGMDGRWMSFSWYHVSLCRGPEHPMPLVCASAWQGRPRCKREWPGGSNRLPSSCIWGCMCTCASHPSWLERHLVLVWSVSFLHISHTSYAHRIRLVFFFTTFYDRVGCVQDPRRSIRDLDVQLTGISSDRFGSDLGSIRGIPDQGLGSVRVQISDSNPRNCRRFGSTIQFPRPLRRRRTPWRARRCENTTPNACCESR